MIKWLLFVIIVIYSLLDAFQTKVLLDIGYTELNPFLSKLMDIFGGWEVVIFAKILTLFFLGFALYLWKDGIK